MTGILYRPIKIGIQNGQKNEERMIIKGGEKSEKFQRKGGRKRG